MVLENIKSVLIVCTGNICRSPMGEGVLRHRLAQAKLSHIRINSAGTLGWDNRKPTSEAIRACSEIGIDISSLRSAPISEQMLRKADLTVAMERHHVDEMVKFYNAPAEKLFLLGDFHTSRPGMEIGDPYGMPISCYRKILKFIYQCSDGLTDKLKKKFNVEQNEL